MRRRYRDLSWHMVSLMLGMDGTEDNILWREITDSDNYDYNTGDGYFNEALTNDQATTLLKCSHRYSDFDI